MIDKKKKQLYKTVFGTPEGQKVIKDLMDFCHFTQPTHDPASTHNSAFNEGKRRVLLRLISFMAPEKAMEVNNNPENYLTNYEVDIL